MSIVDKKEINATKNIANKETVTRPRPSVALVYRGMRVLVHLVFFGSASPGAVHLLLTSQPDSKAV